MNANKSGVPLASSNGVQRPSRAERRRDGLVLVTYWLEAGAVSTAAGAWASTAVSGRWRIIAWAGVTTALAVAAIVVAGPVVAFISHHFVAARPRRPDAD